ncbi:glycosyltransferase [Tunicatimonas pelagia]|uniref:glycosyltransferase n=1 Tax=Tunicatimonas pelagia TaxID=931531 RepID=UPI00266583FB|nr:glycosyltransferase [Tunicatimonas pelagia]WKN42321.1 glycosyltransferase [Tunicatimonas pelagia]
MKRILYAIRQGKIGGGERHLLDLVTHLNKKDFYPIVVSFTPGEMIEALQELGIETYVIPSQSPFDFRVWPRVSELIGKKNIDIIHAHGTRACSNVFWSANKLNIPLLYTVHGWSFHAGQKPYIRYLRQAGEKWLINQANAVINVSHSNFQEGKQKLGLQNATVIQNGVNLTRFDKSKTYPNTRAELGVPSHCTLVGFIARITHQKDPISFVHAAQQVLQEHSDIHFLMVGEGDLKEEAIDLVEKYDIASNFHFQDFRNDVPALLSIIDIYCLPSLWEGLPIGLLEAMAMGKAVLATPVDGTKEIIINQVNGFYIKVNHPQDIAAKIIQLHTNKNLAERTGLSASDLVYQEYDLKDSIRRTEQVYCEIL